MRDVSQCNADIRIPECVLQGEKKYANDVHNVLVYALYVQYLYMKPIPLDFLGHVLSRNVIESVTNIPKIVLIAGLNVLTCNSFTA
jgi:hypothetical protein